MLPSHGRVDCRKCFGAKAGSTLERGKWRLQNDPCHWGSPNPEVLVLGFSKGFTQVDALTNLPFADVPFKGMRDRLGRTLESFGLLPHASLINQQFSNPGNRIAFASLIRCSASRLDERASKTKGEPVYGCTGALIPKSFKEIPDVVENCAREFLTKLPASLRVIVLVGNGDQYIANTKQLLGRLFQDYSDLRLI